MTDDRARFARLVEAATRHQQALEWSRAGGAFVEAARVAVDAGSLGSARQSLMAAGESFRRDDRPTEAARALRMAGSYSESAPSPQEDAAVFVLLASVLAELGAADEALALLDRSEGSLVPALVPAQLDTRIGLVLGHRRKAEARPLVSALEAQGGPAAVAAAFRRGQLARLDGELELARSLQLQVVDALSGNSAAAAGVAAARMELAELALLEGRATEAMAAGETARREHQAAGRRSLALRAEAARTRAAVEAGLDVFPGPLREGLGFARDRGMTLLELDLEIAVGTALARTDPSQARDVLRGAARTADRLSVPMSAGRARLTLIPLCDEDEARALRTQARLDLVDHRPLLARLGDD